MRIIRTVIHQPNQQLCLIGGVAVSGVHRYRQGKVKPMKPKGKYQYTLHIISLVEL